MPGGASLAWHGVDIHHNHHERDKMRHIALAALATPGAALAHAGGSHTHAPELLAGILAVLALACIVQAITRMVRA